MRMDREPHIGEYDAKTNAIYDFPHTSGRIRIRPKTDLQQRGPDRSAALLPVVFQYLIAGRGQLGTIFLKTRQNDEIALIDQGTTEPLNIARTRLLLFGRAAALLLLGDGPGGHRNSNRVPRKIYAWYSFILSAENPTRIAHGMTGADYSDCNAANRCNARTKSAVKCGQIYGDQLSNTRSLVNRFKS